MMGSRWGWNCLYSEKRSHPEAVLTGSLKWLSLRHTDAPLRSRSLSTFMASRRSRRCLRGYRKRPSRTNLCPSGGETGCMQVLQRLNYKTCLTTAHGRSIERGRGALIREAVMLETLWLVHPDEAM